MSEHPIKRYPTIGVCGLDCGMCPRYYTVGSSRCPGCCGPDFFNKHPSCGYITCCVKKKNLEVCAQCDEFPCSRFESWLDGGDFDSFVTHKKAKPNLDFIQKQGIEKFIEQQSERIKLLEVMLKDFDEGRSKSFYCVVAVLLPIKDVKESIESAKEKAEELGIEKDDIKNKAKILKETVQDVADKKSVDLTLRRPSKKK